MRFKLAAMGILLLLTAFVSCIVLWLHTQQRQYRRNRQLITVLVANDVKQSIALVNEGADPNTPCTAPPMHSVKQLLNSLLHRSHSPANHSNTALLLACGAPWNNDISTILVQEKRYDSPQLAHVMLQHGANVNAQDENGWTPLFWAIRNNRQKTVDILLQYRANVNVKDRLGFSPLMIAVGFDAAPAIVHLLIEHGADVNATSMNRWSALYWLVLRSYSIGEDSSVKDIMRQLLVHGANPMLPMEDGDSAIKLAQRLNCRDLLVLIKQHKAKK